MRIYTSNLLAGSGLLLIACAAGAQTETASPSRGLEEIIVTARRKTESIQDVPTTINAVSGAEIQNLNIRKFEDVASVVPGLSMAPTANGVAASASMRGVNYDVNASGNNGTVEFYLNDAPISAGNLFQAVYDIQQVEVLRGPQGTLRGRASPSGSITVTTHRPDLHDFGGYVSATGTNIGGYNGQGAVNIPLVTDQLAIRLAGAYDKNENTRVHSLNSPEDPESKTKSGRMTVRYEPTDSLSFILTGQKTHQDITSFDQVESLQAIDPNAPVVRAAIVPLFNVTYAPPYISPRSRLSVQPAPRKISQDYNNYNLQAQWAFAGQKLNYVGARNEQYFESFAPTDIGGYFSPLAPAVYQGYGQQTYTHAYATAHELRLSNEERLGGIFDYIGGVFYQKGNFPTNLTRPTAVFNPTTTPATQFINLTPIKRRGGNLERSVFGNLTAHIGEALEISGGARYIKYESQGFLYVSGNHVAAADEDSRFHATVWNGSIKYNFSEDFMVYGTAGSSWRPGISVVGDFSLAPSALERSFLMLEPEKSTSYEIGFKSSAFDKKLRTNLALYHQKFTNSPYRSSGGVWYVETFFNTQAAPPAIGQRASSFNFLAPVPIEVNGAEAEIDFAATPDWDMGAVAAIAKSEIKSGLVPCNDFAPHDGIPDSTATTPSTQTLENAVGYPASTISACTVTQRSSSAPQWSASIQSEYRLPITSVLSSFVRGQISLYGNSKNDPTNPLDDYDHYALVNLFTGVRDASGAWEVALYGKNITNTQRVLSGGAQLTTPLNAGVQATSYYGTDATSGITMTPPREFGVNVRYAFGSR